MKLICNVEYYVTVVTSRVHKSVATFKLRYCGGSCVDADGHHIGGGVWCHPHSQHPNYQYFGPLFILHISETNPDLPKSRWTDAEIQAAAKVGGRNWREWLVMVEQAADDGPYGRIA